MKTRDFQDLIVWRRAMELTRACYLMARRLPMEERFALSDQMRRAAVSVPANIAEGHASSHRRVFLRYLGIAQASLSELECLVLICEQACYVSRDEVDRILATSGEVGRMLRSMRRRLSEPPGSSTRESHAAPHARR